MARIVGVDIPRNKKVPYSLSYIHGIGLTTALKLCEEAKVDKDARVQDLKEEQVVAIRNAIADLGLKVEGELRSQVAMNIKTLKDFSLLIFRLQVRQIKPILYLSFYHLGLK